MQLYSHANPPSVHWEVISKKTITETAGYRSTAQIVAEFTQAGQVLLDYRRAVYDNMVAGKVIPNKDLTLDPTRAPGFDMADASSMSQTLNAKIQAQKLASTTSTTAPKGGTPTPTPTPTPAPATGAAPIPTP